MLTPAYPLTPYLLALLLLALLGFMIFTAVRKDRREYRRFKRMRSTKRRQRMLRKLVRESFVNFGGAAVVVLLLSWQFVALFQASVEDWDFVRAGRQAFADSGWLGPTVSIALIVAIVVGMLLGIVLARNETEVTSIGDVAALLPRNRAELKYGAALAINAGVVEELLFRLALPALIFGVTGNSIAAVVASIVIFGALHVYQGLPGIIGATILGAIFMAIYLATGSIVIAIVVHALFDLRSLVVIPVVVFGVHKELGNGAPPLRQAQGPQAGASTSSATESDVDAAGATGA